MLIFHAHINDLNLLTNLSDVCDPNEYNSKLKNFNLSFSTHMNLKQNHYTNFKCISYDITFDVDRIGTRFTCAS